MTSRCDSPDIDGGYRAAVSLLSARPDVDGLICYNDLVATGALRACAELGRSVPDDVAVAGADDILLASLVTPALTTLRVDRQAIGASALQMLLDQLHNASGVCNALVYQPELIVRAQRAVIAPVDMGQRPGQERDDSMNLLIKGAGLTEGYVMIAGPGDGILKMLEFGRVGVVQGRPYTGHTGTPRGGFRHYLRCLPP